MLLSVVGGGGKVLPVDVLITLLLVLFLPIYSADSCVWPSLPSQRTLRLRNPEAFDFEHRWVSELLVVAVEYEAPSLGLERQLLSGEARAKDGIVASTARFLWWFLLLLKRWLV